MLDKNFAWRHINPRMDKGLFLISVRLPPDVFNAINAEAKERNIAFTTLLRERICEIYDQIKKSSNHQRKENSALIASTAKEEKIPASVEDMLLYMRRKLTDDELQRDSRNQYALLRLLPNMIDYCLTLIRMHR